MGHPNPTVNRTDLYRYFDADDRLLYVGISMSAVARATQHRHTAGWWDDYATMTRQTFSTREQALEAERTAIVTEKPLHNVVHNRAGRHSPNLDALNDDCVLFDHHSVGLALLPEWHAALNELDATANRLMRSNSGVTRDLFLACVAQAAGAIVWGDCCDHCNEVLHPIGVIRLQGGQIQAYYRCNPCNHWQMCSWSSDISLLDIA